MRFELRCFLLIMALFGNANVAFSQLTDLARLEYSFIPKSQSEDRYTRLRALLNCPIEIDEGTYFIVGGEYNRILLDLNDNYPFDRFSLNSIDVIDLNLGITFKMNKKWRFGLKTNPRISSTLTKGLESDDFFFNGGVFFINDRTKDSSIKRQYRLILGLTYNASTGIPFPLPFISYFRKVNEHWSFTAGVPKSNLKYAINQSNIVQTYVSLDGYFAHLQEPLTILGKQVDNISMSVIVSGLGYEHNFTKLISGYVYTGYTFRMNNALRDKSRREVFKLDNLNAFYLRTGIKLKI